MKLTRDNTLKHYNLYNNLPENKDQAIQQAINYQKQVGVEQNISYGEIAIITNYFFKIALQFDLIDEFKENGII